MSAVPAIVFETYYIVSNLDYKMASAHFKFMLSRDRAQFIFGVLRLKHSSQMISPIYLVVLTS